MPVDFTIRTFNSQDRPSVVELMEKLQNYEQQLHPNRASGNIISNQQLAYLEKIVQQQDGQIYVAEFNQQIVGFITCFVEELGEGDLHVIENELKYGYISDLYVLSEMRGIGVGTALMVAAEKHFLNLELKVVRVGLLHNNKPAVTFYHQVGYQPYELVYEKKLQIST